MVAEAATYIEIAGSDIVVKPGRYFKVGETRVGTAYLTARHDAALTYTNRRGETSPVTDAQFVRHYRNGMNQRLCGPDQNPPHFPAP